MNTRIRMAAAAVALVGLGIVGPAAPAAAGPEEGNSWLIVGNAIDTAKSADSDSDEGNSWLWAAIEDAVDTAANFEIKIQRG